MLLLWALSIGIVGMVEKDMHGEWVVVQQQQGIRAARIDGGIGIGIIASLLLLRGRRHTLYAFVTTGPCGRPCEPCRGGWIHSLDSLWLMPRATSPSGARPVLSQTRQANPSSHHSG